MALLAIVALVLLLPVLLRLVCLLVAAYVWVVILFLPAGLPVRRFASAHLPLTPPHLHL